MSHNVSLVNKVLNEAKNIVSAELNRIFKERRRTGYGPLYTLLEDYPLREGKGLRPAICLAACRAVGGITEQAILSCAALELFHNAFLLHDDVEDGSEFRRGSQTMLRAKGAPVAINVGDATNVLAMGPLIENTQRLGVRKALMVLIEIERMARESAEGQAIELEWIAENKFSLTDRDYVRMAYKKTCAYTVIAPLRIGVICGLAPGNKALLSSELLPLTELGFYSGIAFQIHDDLLNLEGDSQEYGKENAGDLWEGKRTVILLHFLRVAAKRDRSRAIKILRKVRNDKTESDISWLLGAIRKAGSLHYARSLAIEYSEKALNCEGNRLSIWENNDDRRFLQEMLNYVIDRTK